MIGTNIRIFSHRLAIGMVLLCTLLSTSALASEPIPTGNCTSPKDAILQLLYYVQPGRTEAAEASACMDWGSEVSSPERAVVLKKALDLKNLILNLDAIPASSDYKDPTAARVNTRTSLDFFLNWWPINGAIDGFFHLQLFP